MSNDDFYRGKKVLVTGATGLIGRPLVRMLREQGALVTATSLESGCEDLGAVVAFYNREDLRRWENCRRVTAGQEIVFHLAGIKGGVSVEKDKAAYWFVPQLVFNTHMMEAARQAGAERFLFCSSIGVYGFETFLYNGAGVFPRPVDVLADPDQANWYQGWVKRIGEMQAAAYRETFDWNAVVVARISNTYGPWDNFDPVNAMVIPSLIARAAKAKQMDEPLTAWGTGDQVRDFIYSEDAAQGLLAAVEKGEPGVPLNIGAGVPVKIHQVARKVADLYEVPLEWDRTKPTGAEWTLLNTHATRETIGWEPKTGIEEGLERTVEWYRSSVVADTPPYLAFRGDRLI